MAYATIAGRPAAVGLYLALTSMVVYVLLGTSRVLSVSVTSTISMLTAAVLTTTVALRGDPVQAMLAILVVLVLLMGALDWMVWPTWV